MSHFHGIKNLVAPHARVVAAKSLEITFGSTYINYNLVNGWIWVLMTIPGTLLRAATATTLSGVN